MNTKINPKIKVATNSKQILVIDNDPHMARSVPRRLQLAGYEVVVAQTVDEARHALAHALFHLAIIDIRVEDDRNDTDTSGFMLARQLPPTIPCLIHTAHDTKANIREALGAIGAEDIIAKDDPDAPTKLVARVDELFRSGVGVNFDLEIDSKIPLATIARRLARSSPAQGPIPQAGDLSLVLRRLFSEATTVELTPLLPVAINASHSLSGAVLLKAQEKRHQGSPMPVVLKLGTKGEIAEEAARYRASKPFMGGQRLAQLEGEAYSRSVGGLIYSLIGAQEAGSVQTLSEVFFTQESEIIAGLLQRFFQQTFGQIYVDAQPTTLDLTEHYTTQLGLNVTKLRRRMRAIDPTLLTASTLPWSGLERALPNPLALAMYKGAFRSFGAIETRTSLCHGDLHSRNILVDDEHHFWLIDFARSTTSHILRDFAELESDIKFHVLPLQAQSDFVAFEQALTMPTTWEEEPTAILLPTRLQQAFDIITAVRRTARELLMMSGAMDEYYQALFWHALYIAQVKMIAPERKQQALISAALLSEQFGIQ